MTMRKETTDPIEAIQNLAQVAENLRDRVLALEAKQRVDQDFIHTLTLMIDHPERLREMWKHAVSAITAGDAIGFLKIEENAEPEQLALVKKVTADRFEYWHKRIQLSINLRADDDTE
ncbi:hypothetical protein [Pseudomonas aeruginosa]|uniref:hypothetical protein n=1 Tax=Pseudomonas aeruginosa TaxID=287 RepID=UPI0021F116D4|nr:hypothetical protein [Pseudomonas aeruginosa]MCV4086026.1 hypothetical protein [Pseudomonas aeruginosa]MCV4126016.1 hypothetical protein [Pseudomonas aeruginosa]